MTEPISPTEEFLQQMVKYKIAAVKDGKYVYAPEYESTVKHLTSGGISKFKSIKMAREASRHVSPLLLSNPELFNNKRDLDIIIGSYVCAKLHEERWKIRYTKGSYQQIAYAIWYLNDHEPEVETD